MQRSMHLCPFHNAIYNELQKMWKELVMDQYVVLSQHLLRGTAQNNAEPQ